MISHIKWYSTGWWWASSLRIQDTNTRTLFAAFAESQTNAILMNERRAEHPPPTPNDCFPLFFPLCEEIKEQSYRFPHLPLTLILSRCSEETGRALEVINMSHFSLLANRDPSDLWQRSAYHSPWIWSETHNANRQHGTVQSNSRKACLDHLCFICWCKLILVTVANSWLLVNRAMRPDSVETENLRKSQSESKVEQQKRKGLKSQVTNL